MEAEKQPNPSSKEFEEFQVGPSSKGQGNIQNLEAPKDRSTDKYPYIQMQYKDSQWTQIILEGENNSPPISIFM